MRNESLLIPYTQSKEVVRVFLQKRTADAVRLPNHFGLFGGGAEVGENPEVTLRREIQEELSFIPKDYALFNTYVFSDRIKHVFIMKVTDAFADNVTVHEGQYGKFLSEIEVDRELKIDDDDRLVLRELFNKIRDRNKKPGQRT